MRSYNPNYEGHPGQIKRAAQLLARAHKPILDVGGGVISADASAELRELAELAQLPVTQTLMGLGSFPMEHPLSLDMLGMHGSYYANMAVHHSDVLVAVGARFDDRVTGRVDAFAPNAEIVHIDIDPSSISKNIKVDRKSTRLNSSHSQISYAVFCLKKKKATGQVCGGGKALGVASGR